MRITLIASIGLSLAVAASAHAQTFVDTQGREWYQPASFKGLTWESIHTICPDDGLTPCRGFLAGKDVTGLVWASKEDVQELFAEFAPEMAATETVGGPAYVLPALFYLGIFLPTFDYYTTFGGYLYISGWASTNADGMGSIPEASAQYPVFDGYFNVAAVTETTTASFYRGVWLYKPAPAPACPADLDDNGTVDAADLGILLGAWGSGNADLTADGTVDGQDIAVVLGAWGEC
ncbi:MAG: hypothetical protein JNM94_00830 [Phycisphaerae bacterium]|nr:hypothetical protein [Phycisphaerae bacterium]